MTTTTTRRFRCPLLMRARAHPPLASGPASYAGLTVLERAHPHSHGQTMGPLPPSAFDDMALRCIPGSGGGPQKTLDASVPAAWSNLGFHLRSERNHRIYISMWPERWMKTYALFIN
jgi:hypothetical protein